MAERPLASPDDTQAPSGELLSGAIALALPFLAAALGRIPRRHGRGLQGQALGRSAGELPAGALGRVLLVLALLGLGSASWLVWWTGQVDRREEEAQDALTLYGVHLVLGVLWSWMLFVRGWVGPAFLALVGLGGWMQAVAARFRRVNPVARMLLLPYQTWLLFLVAWNGLLWRRGCCGERPRTGCGG